MTLSEWILSQTIGIKLLLGVSSGLLLYGILRYFIYCANKAYKQVPNRKLNWKENLQNLSSN